MVEQMAAYWVESMAEPLGRQWAEHSAKWLAGQLADPSVISSAELTEWRWVGLKAAS